MFEMVQTWLEGCFRMADDEKLIDGIADKIYEKLTGDNFNLIENDLKLRLAIEQRLSGTGVAPFGFDRMSSVDAAAYLGIVVETLRSTAKRKSLKLPEPYGFAKKLYWRRSELDLWVEQQRVRRHQV
jgi:hypothetical protein